MLVNELNKLAYAVAPVFWNLVYRSIDATVMGFAWLAVCRIFEKYFTPNSKNLLSFMLLICLLSLQTKESSISVMEYVAPVQHISYRQEYDLYEHQLFTQQQVRQTGESDYYAPVPVLKDKVNKLYIKSLVFDVVLPLIWLAGVISGGLWLCITAFFFNKKLQHCSPPDKRITDIYHNLLKTVHMDYKTPVIVTDAVTTPAATGWIKKKILLPEYMTELDSDTVEFALLHELCHIKEWHLGYSYLCLVLQVIYWFNPFLHILFRENRQNMELMADNKALSYTDNHSGYARSMLKILSYCTDSNSANRMLCMADSISNMKKRIASIKQACFFKKNSRKITVASVLLGTCVLLAFYPVKTADISPAISDSCGAMAVEKPSSIGVQSLSIECTLPWNWETRTSKLNPRPESEIPLPLSQFDYTVDLYQDGELIGYLGMSAFEPYTEEIPAEDYHKTVWPELRLSSMCIWDPFTPIEQTDISETGLVNINYVDYEYLNENPDTVTASAPQFETFGILAYNKEQQMYCGFAFMPDKVSRETAEKIARTIILRNDGRKIDNQIGKIYKYTTVEVGSKKFTLGLPENWKIIADGATTDHRGVPLPLGHYGEVEVIGNIYEDDRLIGQIGINDFIPYEGDIAPERYWETVFSPLRLSSFYQWQYFQPVRNAEDADYDIEAGVASIKYLDYTKLDDYPGNKADMPYLTGSGVWAYNKNLEYYICMGFTDGNIHSFTLSDIAYLIEFKQ